MTSEISHDIQAVVNAAVETLNYIGDYLNAFTCDEIGLIEFKDEKINNEFLKRYAEDTDQTPEEVQRSGITSGPLTMRIVANMLKELNISAYTKM